MNPIASRRVAEVIKLANQIAREYDLEYVGTEHLLLAIQREGTGNGAAILTKHGVTTEKLKSLIDQIGKKQLEETWVFGRLPGTPHYRNVMSHAIEQCQQLEGTEVRTEHLLLGLLAEEGSVASDTLKQLGLDRTTLRTEVVELSSGS